MWSKAGLVQLIRFDDWIRWFREMFNEMSRLGDPIGGTRRTDLDDLLEWRDWDRCLDDLMR